MMNWLRWLIKRVFGSRIIRDSSMLMVANYASMFLGMVTSIIVARLLGDTRYGLLLLAMRLVSTIIQFMDIRTGEGLIRFMGDALARDDRSRALTFFLVGLSADALLMLATFALAAVVSPQATRVYAERADLLPLVRVFLFSIPFTTLQGSFSAVLNVYKRFNLLAIGTITSGLILLSCVLALIPRGIEAAMWGYVLAAALTFMMWAVMGGWLLLRRLRPCRTLLQSVDYFAAWKEFLPFAFHTSITQSIKSIAVNIDILVLPALLPVQVVAHYQIATSAANLITLPTAPVSNVIYPEMTEAWARDMLGRVRSLIRRYMLATLGIAAGIMVVYTFAAEWLVRLLYGPEYYNAAGTIAALIMIIGLGITLQGIFRWVRPAALAAGKPQLATFYSLVSIIARMVLIVPFVYFFGVFGAAWAYNIVVVITIGIVLFYVLPELDLWRPFRRHD